MSRAFVKEDSEERWQPPAAQRALQVRLAPDGATVYETDDLLEALRWVRERPAGLATHCFEVYSREGRLLAQV